MRKQTYFTLSELIQSNYIRDNEKTDIFHFEWTHTIKLYQRQRVNLRDMKIAMRQTRTHLYIWPVVRTQGKRISPNVSYQRQLQGKSRLLGSVLFSRLSIMGNVTPPTFNHHGILLQPKPGHPPKEDHLTTRLHIPMTSCKQSVCEFWANIPRGRTCTITLLDPYRVP